MTKKSETKSHPLPLLLFPAKDKATEAWMGKLKREKRIRKIGPRLYTSLPPEEEKAAVRADWRHLLSELFPDALLSHRSALEFQPSPGGTVVLTGTTNRSVSYPGLKLEFVRGPGPLQDDPVFSGFRVSSLERALLENLSVTKASASRSAGIETIEKRLESILRVDGETRLHGIRRRAREIAAELGWETAYKKLDGLIGALLGSRPAGTLSSPVARARAQGRPFDPHRVTLFDQLFSALQATPLPSRPEGRRAPAHFRNKAFFEAYFSNYIEGTTFEIEEAEEIVFEGKIPEKRPKDSHDITSTFALVSDPNEMRKVPGGGEEFLGDLKRRHSILMAARPEALPGEWKEKPNRAGDTHFVEPALVEGTLAQGFARYRDLPAGLPRAIFMMFLVAEVHPFTDGNGRLARIQMNAELVSSGLGTIIIPTVYRDDYWKALKALTRRSRADTLIKALDRAQAFSLLDFSDYPQALRYLEEHHWFRESDDAAIIL